MTAFDREGAANRPFTKADRVAHAQRLKNRSLMIAGASTVAVVAAIVLLVPLAPGWDGVKRSFFSGEVFTETFPTLLRAFFLDVAIFLWCAPAIAIVGLAIAVVELGGVRRGAGGGDEAWPG